MNEVRIDKWMWATRIFKTRTIAAEACKKNRVMINGVNVKPSRMIKVGEVIQVRKPPITFSFKVLDLTELFKYLPADYTIMRRIRFFENLAVMPHIFSPVQTVFYFFAIGIVIRQGKFHRTDNRLNPLPFFLPIDNCNRTDTVHALLFRSPSVLSPKDRDRKEGTKSENRTSTSFI